MTKKPDGNPSRGINMAVELLKIAKMHPSQGRLGQVFICFNVLCHFLSIHWTIKFIRVNIHDLNKVVDSVHALSNYMQGIAKVPTLIIFRKNIAKILNDSKNFWDTDHDLIDLRSYYQKTYYPIRLYRDITTFSSFIYYLAPIFTHKFMFDMWVPQIPGGFWIAMFCQYCVVGPNLIYVLSVDILFFASTINTIAQFKMLNAKLASLGNVKGQDHLKEMKRCIRHHQFLVDYAENMIQTFSYTMLGQYLCNLFGYCTSIYNLTERGNTSGIFMSFIYAATIWVQLALYCFPADELTYYAGETASAIYSSNWQYMNLKVQKFIPMVVHRSQKGFFFSGGGMVTMNRAAFTQIFKLAFSFYTMLKNIKK